MSLVIAALLVGAALPPAPDDKDAPRSRRPVLTAPSRRDQDAKQAVGPAALAAPPDDDDDQKPGRAAPTRPKAPAGEEDEEEGGAQPNSSIVVTARRLDAARTQIDEALGSTVYSLTNDTIENRPGGETGTISEILMQAPGVTLSNQGLTIRGSAANQVRINDSIIPEAISDPADQLSSRLAETTRLITGTLPAQYGFAPAGVISVTTKNGLYEHGGQVELFAGSDPMIEPAIEWAGSLAATSLFASGDLEHDRSNIADAQGIAARDRRTKFGGLGFADHIIDQNDRISLIFGGSREHHAIGPTTIDRGTELNIDGYAVAAFQHSENRFTLQTSLFVAIASDRFRFDASTDERRRSFGTQIDASEALGSSHTLRFGFLATRSAEHELDSAGEQTHAARTSLSVYAQDEWKLARSLTFNPGARVEWLRGLRSGATFEPRASLVWLSDSGLTAHFGYSRYASAPPFAEQASRASLPDEHDDYFDAGIQQKLGSLTLGADVYKRSAHNYIAEHVSPGSATATAFTFQSASIKGVELSAIYAHRGTTAWSNLAVAGARGKRILGGQGLFAPEAIAAASIDPIALGSDRPITFSGGIGQRLGRLTLTGDLLFSSGSVRTLNQADPNGSRRSCYTQLGLAAVYHAKIAGQPTDLRIDLTNLANARNVTSDASALALRRSSFERKRGRVDEILSAEGSHHRD